MKIGLITDNYPLVGDSRTSIPGGIGTYTQLLGEELAEMGHEVHVFSPAPTTRHLSIMCNGVRVWWCPPWSKRREMGLSKAWEFTFRHGVDPLLLQAFTIKVAVQKAAAASRFDVIEAPDLGLLGSLAGARQYCRCYAVRLHGYGLFSNSSRPQHLELDRRQLADVVSADIITAPTNSARLGAERFWGVSLPHVQVVGNPVRLQPNGNSLGAPEVEDEGRTPSALFFGRLIHQKGIDTLAAAIPIIRENIPKFRVTFVGPELTWPDNRIASQVIRACAGEETGFTILPPKSHAELTGLARQHTIAVFPSRAETFGMVLLEAMAWGLPCVVSDIPPFRELARDREHCLFARCEDPDDFANKIRCLLLDKQMRAKMAIVGHNHALQWTSRTIALLMIKAWTSPTSEEKG